MEIHALHFPFGIQSLNYILARKWAFVDKKDADSTENLEAKSKNSANCDIQSGY